MNIDLQMNTVIKYQDERFDTSKEKCAFFLMMTQDKNSNPVLSYFQVPNGYVMPEQLEKDLKEKISQQFPGHEVSFVNIGTLERLKQSSSSIHATGNYAIQKFSENDARLALAASVGAVSPVTTKKRSLIATFFGAPKPSRSETPSVSADTNEVKLKK
ncbi:MAG TPA: hypothetical protein VJL60_04335 [Gammaproteobacteria bacterium]|nr:hypothetical protein [Gammaproteobacteria bacterium]